MKGWIVYTLLGSLSKVFLILIWSLADDVGSEIFFDLHVNDASCLLTIMQFSDRLSMYIYTLLNDDTTFRYIRHRTGNLWRWITI